MWIEDCKILWIPQDEWNLWRYDMLELLLDEWYINDKQFDKIFSEKLQENKN